MVDSYQCDPLPPPQTLFEDNLLQTELKIPDHEISNSGSASQLFVSALGGLKPSSDIDQNDEEAHENLARVARKRRNMKEEAKF